MNDDISDILRQQGSDRARLVDMLWDVQHRYSHIPAEHLPQLGDALNLSPLDVAETTSFHHLSGTGLRARRTALDQALGVLVGGGLTPEQARTELDTRAAEGSCAP